jgi:hypothetical protein
VIKPPNRKKVVHLAYRIEDHDRFARRVADVGESVGALLGKSLDPKATVEKVLREIEAVN